MEKIEHRVRRAAGFTALEALVVVALIGVLVAFSVPSVTRYRSRTHARSHAERVMGVLQSARSQAVSAGQPVLVLFDDPAQPSLDDWPEGVFARIVRSVDNDYEIDDGVDLVTDLELEPGLSDRISVYGQGDTTPFPDASVPDEDEAGGTLGELDQGTSFRPDPNGPADSTVRGVAFTPQGLAVALDAPASPGPGAFYVTDNHTAVYAVVLRTLGNVGIRTLNPENFQWN